MKPSLGVGSTLGAQVPQQPPGTVMLDGRTPAQCIGERHRHGNRRIPSFCYGGKRRVQVQAVPGSGECTSSHTAVLSPDASHGAHHLASPEEYTSNRGSDEQESDTKYDTQHPPLKHRSFCGDTYCTFVAPGDRHRIPIYVSCYDTG
jgi:hypothetical protein